MKMTPVNSSNILAIGYDEETNTLEVDFIGGGTYSYQPVTFLGYKELMNAESKGRHFSRNIKDAPGVVCKKIV